VVEIVEKGIDSDDYRDYVIRDGKFIGAFDEMYRRIPDPWNIGDAGGIQYDLLLYLVRRYGICAGGGRVLDIGAGRGAFTARLKEIVPAAEIHAVDISPTAVRRAQEDHRDAGIRFSVLDIQKDYLGVEEGYDLVVLSQMVWYILPALGDILHHLLDHVLGRGGYLLINQAFYQPGVQKYGREVVSRVEDLIRIAGKDPLELIETNRLTNHNAILLFRNGVE